MQSIYKPKVLLFIDWFLPGYKGGGPIRSVANMVTLLSEHFDFSIVTSDKDMDEKEPYTGIESDTWIQQSNYRIIYLSKPSLSIIKKIIIHEPSDVIYFNSFFSVFFTLLPMLVCKVSGVKAKLILAPRGMLQAGALSVKSFKKKLFIRAAKNTQFFKNVYWHATDPQEKEDIGRIFNAANRTVFAPNIPQLLTDHIPPVVKTTRSLKLVTISLITEKKNILTIIDALNYLPDEVEVVYDVYGPIKDRAYWQRCQERIQSTKPNIRIQYKGVLLHSQVSNVLAGYHFFVLPTLGENFGHAIFEALHAGRPVIISTSTPWQNLQDRKAGWSIDLLDAQALVPVISQAYQMEQSEYDTYCANAQTIARKYIEEADFVAKYQQLLTSGILKQRLVAQLK